ncbi:MAG: TetR/AcrR family transcriptional regulator [Actinomycetota bacterium]|nr:TetR/AcrR family transcriptional regulator [Actinomycetota bacterium]
MSAVAPTRPVGRPRDPDLDRVILDATITLLAQEGFARMSIEQVAARAGVGKASIYRRWPSKVDLVIAALSRRGTEHPVSTGGSVRARLTELIRDLCNSVRREPAKSLLAALVAEIPRNPELASAVRDGFLARRQATAFALLREGVERGELRPDLDPELASDTLVGPIMLRLLLTGGRITRGLAVTLVDAFYEGWGVGRRHDG